MRLVDRLYSLALRAYPPAFREEHEEEMLATLAEVRDAGEPPHHLRQTASLLFGGSRQRWLFSSSGSLAATVRQGLAWGVLILVARQAGLAVYELIQPFVRGWEDPFSLTYLLLAIGWVAAFCLLASGRRRWGLAVLGVVVCGFIYNSVQLALSYGGPFSLPFTLHFFLPVVLPLLAACVWPSRGVTLSAWFWVPGLALAALVPPISVLFGPFESMFGFVYPIPGMALVAVGVLAILVILAVGWSDPRWAVAFALSITVFGGQALVTSLAGSDPVQNGLQIMALWVVVPAGAIILARSRVRAAVSP